MLVEAADRLSGAGRATAQLGFERRKPRGRGGEFISIRGKSEVGKTVLLKIVGLRLLTLL